MRAANSITAINCPSCGAGLDVLGGGRVTTTVCAFCDTALDANEDYKILKKLDNGTKPDSPFEIGMGAVLFGAHFTIIGTMGVAERYRGQVWRWTEHQLYSPTHGYAWLTYEDGHTTFSRRFRDAVYPPWVGANTIETSEQKPYLDVGTRRLTYYESGTNEITYLAGEFTWQPEIGEKRFSVFFVEGRGLGSAIFNGPQDDVGIAYELSKGIDEDGSHSGEREVDEVTYLPNDLAWERFGLTVPLPDPGIHPLRKITPSFITSDLSRVGLLFAALSIILLFVMSSDGEIGAKQSYPISQLPVEIPIEITQANRGVKANFVVDVNNSWAWLDVTVYDPDGAPLFNTGREVGYYHGYSEGESWREGSRSNTVSFRAGDAGSYTLELDIPEGSTWSGSGSGPSSLPTQVTVRVREGLKTRGWLLVALILFLGLTIIGPIRRIFYAMRRLSGSDWSDD